MATRNLGELSVSLVADTSALVTGLDTALRKVEEFQRRIRESAATLGSLGSTAPTSGASAEPLRDLAAAARSVNETLKRANSAATIAIRAYARVNQAANTLKSSLEGLEGAFSRQLAILRDFGGVTTQINRSFSRVATEGTRAAAATTKLHGATEHARASFRGMREEMKANTTGSGATFFADLLHDMRDILFLQARFLLGFQLIAKSLNALGSGVRTVVEFNAKLREIQAVGGASTAQLKQLADIAREVGKTTAVSAVQAADALVILTQAGFTASESQNALRAAVALSVGGFASMEESVRLLTTTLRAFGLNSSESSEVANVLAATVNASKTSVEELNTAFNFAAETAASAGVSYRDTAALLGVLADNGIRASTSGTAIRQVMAALISPTQKAKDVFSSLGIALADISPLTNDFGDILRTLRDAGFGAEAAFSAFERRTGSAAVQLVRNVEAFERMRVAITGTNAAFEAQALAQQSVEAQAQRTANAFNELAIEIGDSYVPVALGALTATRNLAESLQSITPILAGIGFGAFTTLVIGLSRALLALVPGIALLKTIGALIAAWGPVGGIVFGVVGAVSALAASYAGLFLILAAGSSVVFSWIGRLREQKEQVQQLGQSTRDQGDAIGRLIGEYEASAAAADAFARKNKESAAATNDLRRSVVALGAALPELRPLILANAPAEVIAARARELELQQLLERRADLQKRLNDLSEGFFNRISPKAFLLRRALDNELFALERVIGGTADSIQRFDAVLADLLRDIDAAFRSGDLAGQFNALDAAQQRVFEGLAEDFPEVGARVKEVFDNFSLAILSAQDPAAEFIKILKAQGEEFEEIVAEGSSGERYIHLLGQIILHGRSATDTLSAMGAAARKAAKDAGDALEAAESRAAQSSARLAAFRAARASGQSPDAADVAADTAAAEAKRNQARLKAAEEFVADLKLNFGEEVAARVNTEEALDALSSHRIGADSAALAQRLGISSEYYAQFQQFTEASHKEVRAAEEDFRDDLNEIALRAERRDSRQAGTSGSRRVKDNANLLATLLEQEGRYVAAVLAEYEKLRAGATSTDELRRLADKETAALVIAAQKEAEVRIQTEQRLIEERRRSVQADLTIGQSLLQLQRQLVEAGARPDVGKAKELERIERQRLQFELESNRRLAELARQEISRNERILAADQASTRAAQDKIAAIQRGVAVGELTKKQAEEAIRAVQDEIRLKDSVTDRAREIVTEEQRRIRELEQQNFILEQQEGLIQRAGEALIDVGSLLQQTIADAFEGIILGTRKLEDVFEAAGQALTRELTQAFAKSLIEKLGFDRVFKANFAGLAVFAGKTLFSGITGGLGLAGRGLSAVFSGGGGGVTAATLTSTGGGVTPGAPIATPSNIGGGGVFGAFQQLPRLLGAFNFLGDLFSGGPGIVGSIGSGLRLPQITSGIGGPLFQAASFLNPTRFLGTGVNALGRVGTQLFGFGQTGFGLFGNAPAAFLPATANSLSLGLQNVAQLGNATLAGNVLSVPGVGNVSILGPSPTFAATEAAVGAAQPAGSVAGGLSAAQVIAGLGSIISLVLTGVQASKSISASRQVALGQSGATDKLRALQGVNLGLGVGIGAASGAAGGPIGAIIGAAIGAAIAQSINQSIQGGVAKGVKSAVKGGFTQDQLNRTVVDELRNDLILNILSGGANYFSGFAQVLGPSLTPDIERFFDKKFEDILQRAGFGFISRSFRRSPGALRDRGTTFGGGPVGGAAFRERRQGLQEGLDTLPATAARFVAGVTGASGVPDRIQRWVTIILNSSAAAKRSVEEVQNALQGVIRFVSGQSFSRALRMLTSFFKVFPARGSTQFTRRFQTALEDVVGSFGGLIGENTAPLAEAFIRGDFLQRGRRLNKFSREAVQEAGAAFFDADTFEKGFASLVSGLKDALRQGLIEGLVSAFLLPVLAPILVPFRKLIKQMIRKGVDEAAEDGFDPFATKLGKKISKAAGDVKEILDLAKPFLEDLFGLAQDAFADLDAALKTPLTEFQKLIERFEKIQTIVDGVRDAILTLDGITKRAFEDADRLLGKIFAATRQAFQLEGRQVRLVSGGPRTGRAEDFLSEAGRQQAFFESTARALSVSQQRTLLGDLERTVDTFLQATLDSIQDEFGDQLRFAAGFGQLGEAVNQQLLGLRVQTPGLEGRERLGLLQAEIARQQDLFRTGTEEERLQAGSRLQELFSQLLELGQETLDVSGPEFQGLFAEAIRGLAEIEAISTARGEELESLVAEMNRRLGEAQTAAVAFYEFIRLESLRLETEERSDADLRLQAVLTALLGENQGRNLADAIIGAVSGVGTALGLDAVLSAAFSDIELLDETQLNSLADKISAVLAVPFGRLPTLMDALLAFLGVKDVNEPLPDDGTTGGPGDDTQVQLPSVSGSTFQALRKRSRLAVGGRDVEVEFASIISSMKKAIAWQFDRFANREAIDLGELGVIPGNVVSEWFKVVFDKYLDSLAGGGWVDFTTVAQVAHAVRIKLREFSDQFGTDWFSNRVSPIFDAYFNLIPSLNTRLKVTPAARGMILAGEAGPEAILPLNRDGMRFFVDAAASIIDRSATVQQRLAESVLSSRQFSNTAMTESVVLHVAEGAIQISYQGDRAAGTHDLPRRILDAIKKEVRYGDLGRIVTERTRRG